MKWLILLGLLSMVVVFVGARYRRQIQTGIYLWRMFRKMRQTGKTVGSSTAGEKRINESGNAKNVPLVRCAKCGKWIPQTAALNLRSKTFFCSSNCLENAVKVG